MELLKIKPFDSTFFGTGKQFNFGDNDFINTKTTPYPSVFFGAIFTALMLKNTKFGLTFVKENNPDHEKILKIGQVYLYNEKLNNVYITAPKDLFINNKSKVKTIFGRFDECSGVNSLSLKKILKSPSDKSYKRVKDDYINVLDIFGCYLYKENRDIKIVKESDIFVKSNKVGIGISKNTRTVENDLLYKIQQNEFIDNEWSYLVEYKLDWNYLKNKYGEIKDLDEGYLKLGGEGKLSKYVKIENSNINEFKESLRNNKEILLNLTDKKIFKIIFTSPTYFEQNINKVFEGYGNILGISNDKPINIGGFDMNKKVKNKRKIYRGYRAGTVLLVEVNKANDFISKIDKIMQSDNPRGFNKFIIMEDY